MLNSREMFHFNFCSDLPYYKAWSDENIEVLKVLQQLDNNEKCER